MSDKIALYAIEQAMTGICMVLEKPVHNTTKKECYKALQTIQDILIQNRIQHFYDAAKYLSEDIQHVGYSQEACGYNK